MNQKKMEEMEYFISLLDDYIDDKLNQGKTEEIEKMIQEDAFYKEVLKQHVELRANVRITGEAELRKRFTDQFERIPEPVEERSNPWKTWLSLLLIAAMAIATYFFVTSQDNTKEKKPYIETIEDKEGSLLLASVEDPSYDLLRSQKDSEIADQWQTVVQSFISKNYQKVLDELAGIETDQSFVSDHIGKFSLMKGVSLLKLEKYSDADQALAQITSENPYHDQAQWYRALTSFYSKDRAEAKYRLDQIANSPDHYKRTAVKMYLQNLSE